MPRHVYRIPSIAQSRRGEADRKKNLAPPPRVVVMVGLADAREVMEEDRVALIPEMAAMLKEIAEACIEDAEDLKISQRRAADYRLRR